MDMLEQIYTEAGESLKNNYSILQTLKARVAESEAENIENRKSCFLRWKNNNLQ